MARRHDIMPGQIRYWRRTFSAFDASTAFVPVNVDDGDGVDRGARGGENPAGGDRSPGGGDLAAQRAGAEGAG